MEFLVLNKIEKELDNRQCRSAWDKGVLSYAKELVENLKEYAEYDGEEPCNERLLQKAMLNGADNWSQYSWGGCSEIYNGAIAARLCTPSQLKKTRDGEWNLRAGVEWLDLQARALAKAASIIVSIYRKVR